MIEQPSTDRAPLVPTHVDCTDLDGFMLNVERLMASELVALSSHEVIGAALMLWCRAWKQRPAASLPNDDKVIAAFARLPMARFKKLRDEVLRGFVLCSDGRLYHTTLAKEAVNAYERKTAFQRKRESDAERLRKWRSGTHAETPHETQSETRFVAEGQGQGQGQGQGIEIQTPTLRVPPPGEKSMSVDDLVADGVPKQVANDWMRVRKAKRSPLTRTAWAAVKREAEAAGLRPAEAVQMAAENAWQGFRASWVNKPPQGQRFAPVPLSTTTPSRAADETSSYLADQAAHGRSKPPPEILAMVRKVIAS